MSDIKDLVQTTLDTTLYPNVLSYWLRKSGGPADEYIVYSQNGDNSKGHADDIIFFKAGDITVRYYYRAEKIDSYTGRQAIITRIDSIQTALEEAGFSIPGGSFDVGDVDGIGYFVTVFECEYWRDI
ncbi:MAG: hypothetical protein PHX14_10040 [Syntrophomonadaceae bacterium]|nr:hypothetical protein [Syntrophomonadaceae bacterium]